MKNIFLIIIAIVCIGYSSIAQTSSNDSREKVQFGLKVGFNYANVYDSEGEEFKTDGRVGFAGGLFMSVPINKYIGLQPEVLFSQKGFQGSGKILGAKYEFSRTTNYIDIPLLVALKPIRFATILIGPHYSYLLSQKDVFQNGITTVVQEQEFQKDNIRNNLFGLTIGADINIKHFVLSARAAYDLISNKGDGTSTAPRYKNAWYQFTVGYKL
jgi:hypothetical protein